MFTYSPVELFYKDFFEPPSRVKPAKVKKPSKATSDPSSSTTSKVRFHEEVRVKKIKPKGKNLPVATMFYEEDDEDDEDEDGTYENEEEDGSDEDDEMDDDDEMVGLEGDEDDADDVSTEDDGLTTMERFKDDLFADDDDEEPQEGTVSC